MNHNRVSKETQEERIDAFKKTIEFPLSRDEITDTPQTQGLVQSWRALDYQRKVSEAPEAAEIQKAQELIAGHRDNILVLDWLLVNDREALLRKEINACCDNVKLAYEGDGNSERISYWLKRQVVAQEELDAYYSAQHPCDCDITLDDDLPCRICEETELVEDAEMYF